MRVITTMLVLLLSAGSTWAEWEKVLDGSDGTEFYIDPTTIRREGNLRRVWEMENLKSRYKDGELSRRSRLEIDCKQERYRFISRSTHSGAKLAGDTLSNSENLSWGGEIPPDTPFFAIMKKVCK